MMTMSSLSVVSLFLFASIWPLSSCDYDYDDDRQLRLILMLAFNEEDNIGTGLGLGPAAAMAIEEVKRTDLSGRHINWTVIETGCNAMHSVRQIIRLFNAKTTYHGVIGPQCASVCAIIGFITGTYDTPEVTYGCLDRSFAHKTMFPTLTKTSPSLDYILPPLVLSMIVDLNLPNLLIVTPLDSSIQSKIAVSVEQTINRQLKTSFTMEIGSFTKSSDGSGGTDIMRNSIADMLKKMKPKYSVYLLLTSPYVTYMLLEIANDLGMLTGDNIFMATMISSVELFHAGQWTGELKVEDDKENTGTDFEVSNGLIAINFKMPETQAYRSFVQRVTHGQAFFDEVPELAEFKKFTNPPRPILVDSSAGLLYDAIRLWAKGISLVEAAGLPINGETVTGKIKNIIFPGVTGVVKYNSDNERLFDLQISVVQNKTILKLIGNYSSETRTLDLSENALAQIVWQRGKRNVLRLNQKDTRRTLIGVISIFVAVVILAIILFCAFRRLRLNMAIKTLNHKFIKWSEINFYSFPDNRSQGKSDSTQSDDPSFESFVINDATDVGYYREKKIVVKMMKQTKVDIRSKQVLVEVLQIQKIHHHCINAFVGVCVESPNVCVCMTYCPKGSLWDIISQRMIPMTWDFRMSIALDIAKGMIYLHSSAIGSHGHLTSTNCVIDDRWSCKITDYGLGSFRRPDRRSVSVSRDNDEDDLAFVWTAPELLRLGPFQRPLLGTKAGDLYSYGIIIHEICFQTKPFGSLFDEYGPSYIVSLVKMSLQPPHFRPIEESDRAEMDGDVGRYSPKWLSLMELCWSEDPSERIGFRHIVKRLSDINEKKQIRAIDSMIEMLEVYTTRLESTVYDRNQLVVEEKKKADSLLYSILPKVVADRLKEGQRVLPEQFEAITIFISDIVMFTPLAAASTPLEVVNFLDLLYHSFDEIIDNHGVYKVETIGDAYVVAGGLPVRNGNLHVIQIALFALEILRLVLNFTIPHMPNKKLEIRIGLHTGSILAGVVGLKMPRYCLFGTTLTTANHMEATSPVNSVHASHVTGQLLLENGGFILAEYKKMDYEDHKEVMTYRLRGYNRRRISMATRLPRFP